MNILDVDEFNNYLERKMNGEELDDFFFFDRHAEEFDEDMIRKYKDVINLGDLFDRRNSNDCELFSTEFIREVFSWGLLDDYEMGDVVTWESGLWDYASGLTNEVKNKELLDEYIDKVKYVYTEVYGPHLEKMTDEKRKKRLFKYI